MAISAAAAFVHSGLLSRSTVLLADSFDDVAQSERNWYRYRPHLNSPMPSAVDFVDGTARLRNRGGLLSVPEFPPPISLRFRWKWTKGDASYCDVLTVGIRTAGSFSDKWSYQLLDGVQIEFLPVHGRVGIKDWNEPSGGGTIKNSLPMPRDEWLSVCITDDGQRVSVYVGDEAQPVATALLPSSATRHCIALFNREPVADIAKESFLDDIRIEALPVAP